MDSLQLTLSGPRETVCVCTGNARRISNKGAEWWAWREVESALCILSTFPNLKLYQDYEVTNKPKRLYCLQTQDIHEATCRSSALHSWGHAPPEGRGGGMLPWWPWKALDCYGLLTQGYELAGDLYSIVTLSMCLKHFIKIHFKCRYELCIYN